MDENYYQPEENVNMLRLQNNNTILKNEFLEKDKIVKELEKAKREKEVLLEAIQSCIKTKLEHVEKEQQLKKLDYDTQVEWSEKLDEARAKKFSSLMEYQNQMTKLRNQIFCSDNMDDEKVSGEIQELLEVYEELCRKNNDIQLKLDEKNTTLKPESEVYSIIERIEELIFELDAENASYRDECQEIEKKLSLLTEKKSISKINL